MSAQTRINEGILIASCRTWGSIYKDNKQCQWQTLHVQDAETTNAAPHINPSVVIAQESDHCQNILSGSNLPWCYLPYISHAMFQPKLVSLPCLRHNSFI